jgi:hypothetical protein
MSRKKRSTSKRQVSIASDVAARLAGAARAYDEGRPVVAFDPGSSRAHSSSRTGVVGITGEDFVQLSMQGEPLEAVEAARAWSPLRPALVVVEEPAWIGIGNQWRLAEAFGMIEGAVQVVWPGVALWTVKPNVWRAVHGLNVGASADVARAVSTFMAQRDRTRTPSYWSTNPDAASAGALACSARLVVRAALAHVEAAAAAGG